MLVLLHGAGGVMKMPRLLGLVGTLPHFGNAQADAAVVDRDAVVADQHHFPAATERADVRQLRTGTPIVSISRKLCLMRSRPAQTPIASWGVDWQEDLTAAAAQLLCGRKQTRGLVLASTKLSLFSGVDLKALIRLRPSDARRVHR